MPTEKEELCNILSKLNPKQLYIFTAILERMRDEGTPEELTNEEEIRRYWLNKIKEMFGDEGLAIFNLKIE